jgi:type I restriction enzyme S subunit
MSEWKEYKLGQLVERGSANLQTGPFGTMLNASEYTTTGVPVIAVQDIGENKLNHNKFVYVNENTVSRLSRYKVKEGDIIFGRKGAVERRAKIKKNEEGWLQGSDCIRLRFDNSIDSTFISYQFGSKSYREWMLQNSTGATMPSLNQEVLKLLPIILPPLPEQKAIAQILSSLDDKIDLLHRQNKTLEAIAETLFRQWFIEEAREDWEEKT